MLEHIRAVTQRSDFVDIYILGTDGAGFTIHDEDVSFGNCAYFLKTMGGERTIARVEASRTGLGEECFVLMVPMMTDGEITGVVSGVLTTSGIGELLRMKNYSESETFITDSAGNIIAGSESLDGLLHNDDLFSVFADAEFDEPYSALETVKTIHARREGFVSYSIDGEHWYLCCLPIEINDWTICTAIHGGSVDATMQAELVNGYLIIGVAMACAALLVLVVIALFTGAGRRARKEREQLLVAREEYRVSARQSGAMILRYNIRSHRLTPNEIMTERYGLPKDAQYGDDAIFLDDLIAPESMAEYKAFWESIQNGDPDGRIECRMKEEGDGYAWYSFEFKAIFDERGNSIQAIITLRNVTQQHEKTVAYERWRCMMSALVGTSLAYMEINLTSGVCEIAEGEFQTQQKEGVPIDTGSVLAAFERTAVDAGDQLKFRTFFNRERLIRLFESGMRKDSGEIRIKGADGNMRLCEIAVQMTAYPNSNDVKAVIAITDLGDGTSNIERLSDLAFRDDLSGLLNRTASRAAIEEALRFGDSEIVALFMIDIDNFKQVNDTLGHQIGDEALVRISETIKNMFRTADVVARVGGDEFFVFLPDVTPTGFVQTKAESLCNALRLTFSNGVQSVSISSSIGVIVAKRDKIDYETLYSEADYALYEAKNAGKNRYCIRRQDMPVEAERIRTGDTGYFVQLYTLLKHLDGGVVILEVGESVRTLFSSKNCACMRCGGAFDEDRIHPDDRAYTLASLKQKAVDGLMLEIAYRNRQADGDYAWSYMQAVAIPYSGSNLPVMIATITDITELKRSVSQLEPMVAKASTGMLILRFGERMEATFFNDAFLKILNMNYEQFKLTSRDCAALLRPAAAKKLRDDVNAARESGRPLEFSFLMRNQMRPKLHKVFVRGIKIDEQDGVPAYLLFLFDEGEADGDDASDLKLF
jgi:diguanylate cyclase (GGDEF)-like protein